MRGWFAIIVLAGIFGTNSGIRAQQEWTEPEPITFDGTSIDPRVAMIDNEIYIVAMGYDAKFLKSSDRGQSWTEPVFIAPSMAYSVVPDLACSNGYIHVILSGRPESEHYRSHVMVVTSDNGGNSWGEPRTVFRGDDNINKLPEIAAENNMVYAAAEIHSKLVFKRSQDNGITWGDSVMLEEDGIDHWPVMAVSGPFVHIIYVFNPEPYMTDICYRRSEDYGLTWSERVYMSDHDGIPPPYQSGFPSISAGPNGKLLVLWAEFESDDRDLVETVSSDNGETWSEAAKITFGRICYESSSLILNGKFYAIWPDYNFNLPFHRRIAYSESDDFGETWAEPIIISGNDDTNDYNPALAYTAIDGDTIFHCITRRNIYTYEAIYYFNNTLESTPADERGAEFSNAISMSACPNPFNSVTTFTIDVQSEQYVEMSIYNIMGQRVSTLFANYLSMGRHRIMYNADGLSSGIYIMRLVSQDIVKNIRITLLK